MNETITIDGIEYKRIDSEDKEPKNITCRELYDIASEKDQRGWHVVMDKHNGLTLGIFYYKSDAEKFVEKLPDGRQLSHYVEGELK